MKAVWQTSQRHPPEYRAYIDGATCIVRTVKVGGLIMWQTIIHRDTEPVQRSTHGTYWDAIAYAEANA